MEVQPAFETNRQKLAHLAAGPHRFRVTLGNFGVESLSAIDAASGRVRRCWCQHSLPQELLGHLSMQAAQASNNVPARSDPAHSRSAFASSLAPLPAALSGYRTTSLTVRGQQSNGLATYRRWNARGVEVASRRRWYDICVGGTRSLRAWPRARWPKPDSAAAPRRTRLTRRSAAAPLACPW